MINSLDTPSVKLPLTVTQLTQDIRLKLEEAYDWVQVKGEISNFKKAPSGHAYFCLKDKDALLNCVAWRDSVIRWSSLQLEDGLDVIAGGKITVYPPRGTYQFVVSSIRLGGTGALQQRFEMLKRRLADEGIFDSEKKQSLPVLPKAIAVITSPSGAAIRDFLNVFRQGKYPVKITVCPVLVQGEKAAGEIAETIKLLNQVGGFDLLVLCRGGGSLEDLWAFNEESVARAIFHSKIPVITGVGHEIDFTIADFAADVRASTPTAAAQVICTAFDDFQSLYRYLSGRFFRGILPCLQREREKITGLKKAIFRYHPINLVHQQRQRMDECLLSLYHSFRKELDNRKKICLDHNKNLDRLVRFRIEQNKQFIEKYKHLLNSYDPKNTLNRGFAICYTEEGSVVSSTEGIAPSQEIHIKLSDGLLQSTVTKVTHYE